MLPEAPGAVWRQKRTQTGEAAGSGHGHGHFTDDG